MSYNCKIYLVRPEKQNKPFFKSFSNNQQNPFYFLLSDIPDMNDPLITFLGLTI